MICNTLLRLKSFAKCRTCGSHFTPARQKPSSFTYFAYDKDGTADGKNAQDWLSLSESLIRLKPSSAKKKEKKRHAQKNAGSMT